MKRARISTTVDRERLERARRLELGRDSELFDAALVALIASVEHQREMNALGGNPYDVDDELAVPRAPLDWDEDLPYDGGIPDDIVRLARERRRGRAR